MSAHLLNAGKAAWVSEASTAATYADRPTLSLDGTGADEKRAFLWFPNPIGRLGDSILSATLTLYLKNSWSGTVTLTASRVTESWKQNTVKWGASGSSPAITSTNAATATVTDGVAGDAVTLDLTAMLTDVAAGGAWYGIRLEIDATGPLRVHSPTSPTASYRPTLLVDMTVEPDAPDSLNPNGTSFAIDDALPILKWAFSSSDANAYQAESQVQITDTEATYSAAVYDSGWVSNDITNWDTSLDSTAPPALDDATQYWWRVRVRDQNGQQSDWSDEGTFFHASTGDIQIVDPEYDEIVVADSTPTITWYTDDREQRAVRIKVWSCTGTTKDTLLFTREWTAQQQDLTTTDTDYPSTFGQGYDSYTIPSTVPNRRGDGDPIIAVVNGDYAVEVAMRDEYARHDDDYISDTRYFTFTPAETETAPASLAATATGGVVELTWTRATEPDYWVILRDGTVIAEEIGADLFTSGTSYRFRDYTAQPGVAYTYTVRAKTTSGGISATPTGVAVTLVPVGVWLLDPDNDIRVPILGDNAIPQSLAETSASFAPLNRRDPVRIVSRVGGYEGNVSGTLATWGGYTASTVLAQLEDLVGQRSTDKLRLVFGIRNIPVNIGALTVSQHPSQGNDVAVFDVSFAFWQVGNFSVAVN